MTAQLNKKGGNRLVFVLITILCTLSISLFLFKNKVEREKSHYSEQQAILETAYRAAIQSYRLAMESFFDNALNTPETLELFRQGVDSQGAGRDLARGKLYRHLYSAYESMKRQNLRQLHFHLADGTSYLRFQQPDRYGDALFETRASVRICNSEKIVVQGLELGTIRSGFCYVFPLMIHNRHLGSVEVSVTFKSILDALKELAPDKEYGYVLHKSQLEHVLLPEQRWLYSPSNLNDQYVVEDANATLPNSPPPLSNTAKLLNAQLDKTTWIKRSMASGEILSQSLKLSASTYTITLLPLTDIGRQLAGYLITYARDPLLAQIQKEFFVLVLYSLFALLLIFSLVWRLNQRTLLLQEEQRNLSAMNNALGEGVYVQDIKGVIERINPAACQLLGYGEHELVGQIAHDLFHRQEDSSICPREECPFYRKTHWGENFDSEEYFLCKDGTMRLMEIACRPIFHNQEVVGAVVAFHDITDRKQTEAALLQSEALGRRLSTAVEQSPASVVITDAEGSIEYINQKFTQITGYSFAEVQGKNPRLLKSGCMADSIYKNLWATITAGFEWKGELQNRRKDGSLFWESISISPIRNESGCITHFIAIKEDISARIRMESELRENERIQRTLIESLPIGLAIIDGNTRIIEEVNPFAAALLCADREDIIGHRCHNFLCPSDEGSCPIADLGLLVDNSDRVILQANGHAIPVIKTVRTVTIKGRTKMLECFVDIRERKKAEEDIHKANRQLEIAIARAEQLALDAETANKAKSQFLANMSHEIRTPMNAIIGMTHLAMQSSDSDKRQRFLETVQHSAESLLGLLNDILDFSKMEAGQLELNLAPFSPQLLFDGVLATLQMPAEEKGLELRCQIEANLPKCLVGDDMRLRQILLNLIGNAIKFTEKGTISLHINQEASLSSSEHQVHIRVTDTGIGIPQDKLSQIFNSFEQVDNTYVRQYGGTGLGLSICRQLTSLMSGSIWAESVPSSGSTFHVLLPLQACTVEELPVEASSVSNTPSARTVNLRILVVDDNEVNRDVAVMLLEQEHTVTTANNGLEGLEILAGDDFDIVLMDVQMPVMDGLRATRIIRQLENGVVPETGLPEDIVNKLLSRFQNKHLLIIAMTAHAMGGDREMCLEAEMDAYITKPFQPAHLLEVLHSLRTKTTTAPAQRLESLPQNQPLQQVETMKAPSEEEVTVYLQESTGLTPPQIQRILAAVQTSLTDNLAKAETAAASGDLATLAKASHTLKGTLLQCGLDQWAGKAQSIYDAAKQEQERPYSQQLAAIRNGMCHLLG